MVSKISESRNVVSYLDLLIDISNGDLVAQLLTRGMHLIFIVNFHDLSGNILTAAAYGTYISQLIRYCRACHHYDIPCS